MADPLEVRLENIWQFLMVIGEDTLARTVAEAKQVILRQAAQLRGEPQVFIVTADDGDLRLQIGRAHV